MVKDVDHQRATAPPEADEQSERRSGPNPRVKIPAYKVDELRRAVDTRRPDDVGKGRGQRGQWTAKALARRASTLVNSLTAADLRPLLAQWRADESDAPALHRLRSRAGPPLWSAVLVEELLNWSLVPVDEMVELVAALARVPSFVQTAMEGLGSRSTIYRRLKELSEARGKFRAPSGGALVSATPEGRAALRSALLAIPQAEKKSGRFDNFTLPGVWSVRMIPVEFDAARWRRGADSASDSELPDEPRHLIVLAMELRTGAYIIELLAGKQQKTRSTFLAFRLGQEFAARGGSIHLPENCRAAAQPLAYLGLIAEAERLNVQVHFDMPAHCELDAVPVLWCPTSVDPLVPVCRFNGLERPGTGLLAYRAAVTLSEEGTVARVGEVSQGEGFRPRRRSAQRGRPLKQAQQAK